MFTLNSRSLKKLEGVNPILVELVHSASQICVQTFIVVDGLRTLAQQKELVRRGASKTLKSKHLTGHAVDLVPYIGSKPRWEWPLIYPIALAMQQAARTKGVKIRWGGVWDRELTKLSSNLEVEVLNYAQRHPGPDFLDGPHYELMG
jgi:peptidoglycan L-alanyl-D-glutamate endopeptidase CwlK